MSRPRQERESETVRDAQLVCSLEGAHEELDACRKTLPSQPNIFALTK